MKSLFRVELSEVFNDLKAVGIWTTGLSLRIPVKVNLILLYKHEYMTQFYILTSSWILFKWNNFSFFQLIWTTTLGYILFLEKKIEATILLTRIVLH